MVREIKNPTPITTSIARKTNATIQAMPGKIREISSKTKSGLASALTEMVRNPKVVKDWSKTAGEVVKHALHHYWIGTKLLWADISTATRLVLKVTKGYTLTRRERAQLVRTAGDLFRLVPFAVFVIVPFAELLLPVTLKLFPNMLPSTYEDKLKKEKMFKKQLMARIELAKFLQDTVEEMAEEIGAGENTEEMKKQATELREFIRKVRQGEIVSNEDIIKYSKLFSDEITLDNVSRPQLVALSKYMGLSPFGGDGILRFQLRSKLRQLSADDRMIHWEGVGSLSQDELISACRDRGMRYIGLPKDLLKQQLNEWIELSLNKSVPALLLLLSRAFTITTERHLMDTTQALQSTISTFPDEMLDQVLPSDHENARRLEELLHQEKLIEQEEKEREEQEAQRQAAAAAAAAAQAALATSAAAVAVDVTQEPAIAATTAVPSETPLPEKTPLEEAKEVKMEIISEKLAEEEEEEIEESEKRPAAVLQTLRRELDDHVHETEQLGEHLAMDAVEKRIKKLLDTISKEIDTPNKEEGKEEEEEHK